MTAVIIAVIVILIAVGVVFATVLSPKARRERALRSEREDAVHHHREVASARDSEAEAAEREARQRRREAERAERAAADRRESAEDHKERAELHEDGRLDHELDHGPDAADVPERDPRQDRAPAAGDADDDRV